MHPPGGPHASQTLSGSVVSLGIRPFPCPFSSSLAFPSSNDYISRLNTMVSALVEPPGWWWDCDDTGSPRLGYVRVIRVPYKQ